MGDDKGKVQAWRNIKTDIGGRMMGFVCTIATMRGHRTVRRYSVFPASPGMPATSSRWQTGWRGNGGLSVLRSEEHTSALQSLIRISYAVFCFKQIITDLAHNTAYTT